MAGPAAPPVVGTGLGRVAIIMMENKDFGQIIGNRAAPYMNKLARRAGLATQFYAVTMPSLPNYMALTSGEEIFSGNCNNCSTPATNIVDQMEAADISWKAYLQSVPSRCYNGPDTYRRYAKRHNPFIYYDNIRNDPERCNRLVGFRALRQDLEKRLPRYVWITPNLCNDMHDCSIRTGDKFLERWVPRILQKLGANGVLFITFDEGQTPAGCCTYADGGHIVTIVAGEGAKPGGFASDINHYSVLRAIEDGWGLPRLGKAAAPETPSMDGMFDF